MNSDVSCVSSIKLKRTRMKILSRLLVISIGRMSDLGGCVPPWAGAFFAPGSLKYDASNELVRYLAFERPCIFLYLSMIYLVH